MAGVFCVLGRYRISALIADCNEAKAERQRKLDRPIKVKRYEV